WAISDSPRRRDDQRSHAIYSLMPKETALANVTDAPGILGARLREIRLRNGVGLRELARRLDLSPSAISQIETGKMQPSVRTLYAFASAFGVPVDEVLFEQQTATEAGTGRAGTAQAAAGPG